MLNFLFSSCLQWITRNYFLSFYKNETQVCRYESRRKLIRLCLIRVLHMSTHIRKNKCTFNSIKKGLKNEVSHSFFCLEHVQLEVTPLVSLKISFFMSCLLIKNGFSVTEPMWAGKYTFSGAYFLVDYAAIIPLCWIILSGNF